MRLTEVIILFFSTIYLSKAQSSQLLPDTILSEKHQDKYCKKGVAGMVEGKALVFDYEIVPKFSTNYKENSIEKKVKSNEYMTRWHTKFKLPLVNRPSLKMAIGFKYSREEFEFNESESGNGLLFEGLNDKPLKSAGTALYLFKAFNNRHYISARSGINFNGDYSKFISLNNRYLNYSFGALFGIKKNDFVEYGFGFEYANYFGRNSFYPVLMYNQTFNKNWGIEISLPIKAMARYNVSKNTLLYAGFSGGTANYAINLGNYNGSPNQFMQFRNLEEKFSVSIEQKIYSVFWMGLQAGYRMNISSTFTELGGNNKKQLASSAPYGNGLYVNASLFISISKEMIAKRMKNSSKHPSEIF